MLEIVAARDAVDIALIALLQLFQRSFWRQHVSRLRRLLGFLGLRQTTDQQNGGSEQQAAPRRRDDARQTVVATIAHCPLPAFIAHDLHGNRYTLFRIMLRNKSPDSDQNRGSSPLQHFSPGLHFFAGWAGGLGGGAGGLGGGAAA